MADLVTREECANHVGRMLEKLDKIDSNVDNLTIQVSELPKKIFDEADKRYAPKEAWLAIKFVIILGAAALVGAVLKLVIIQ